MNNDQESLQFWSTILQSLADSDSKSDLCPDISNPMLVMSTSIDALSDPSNAPGDGDKTGPGKAITKIKDKNINGCGQRSSEKRIETEDAKEEVKNLGKRARTNEARNIAEKRRRTDIKTKIENLKQLTPNCKKRQSMGPMLPLGMKMDFPAPWCPFIYPNYIMPPFNGFTPGETSGGSQQILPVTTTKGLNNQPHSSKSV